MDYVNAIAKVRFSSAKPQRVVLHKGQAITAELFCLEPGQHVTADRGEWTYYVVAGTAQFSHAGQSVVLPTGQLACACADEVHKISNDGEQRLVCLAVGKM